MLSVCISIASFYKELAAFVEQFKETDTVGPEESKSVVGQHPVRQINLA